MTTNTTTLKSGRYVSQDGLTRYWFTGSMVTITMQTASGSWTSTEVAGMDNFKALVESGWLVHKEVTEEPSTELRVYRYWAADVLFYRTCEATKEIDYMMLSEDKWSPSTFMLSPKGWDTFQTAVEWGDMVEVEKPIKC